MNRDEFSSKTKTIVSQRAAYHCSFPDCRLSTLAASTHDKESSTNIGVVAHISAASPGGPRYDASLSLEERSSVSNAIFLCATHAALIDKNCGVDFPTQKLLCIKSQHEEWVIGQQRRAVGSRLEVVDALVDNAGNKYPSVDVRLLNHGEEPVYLTRGVVETVDRLVLLSNRRGMRRELSYSYNVEIGSCVGDQVQFELSQVIPPKDADRFELNLRACPIRAIS
ncbi:hypothetical protein Mal64_15520 [Pseudobythopirellula maris]|uniref:Uncharacterized protein n=1 Tax=Pseudobythopirellula maris TaxID=2527991 RepID=A0A5C5ZLQ8_9BACT|nr:hypothetical protein Mal64_15520 [Pseudobythopirellula maris]